MVFELILIGHGKVARRFVELLEDRRRLLGLSARIVGIATRHSYVVSGFSRTCSDTLDFLRDAIDTRRAAARDGRLIVVETTTLDVARGEPAVSYVRAALEGGAHVISTNKGPAACAYRALHRAAQRAGRRWLFEGAVMDGV